MSESSENKPGSCEVCQQPTERKCIGCKLVYFCSPEHQKENWKIHREKCRAYELGQSQELGRFLRATRDLEPGDLIFSELPLVFGPKPHTITEGPVPCVGCCRSLEQESCARCPECSWPACNPQCEGLKDNFRHGLECRVLKMRPPPIPGDFYQYFRFDVLIVLRALFLQKDNKVKWDQLIKLEDHLDKRGPGTDTFKSVEEKVKFLEDNYFKPLKAYEVESGERIFGDVFLDVIHKIYAILDVNATELTDGTNAFILYPTASLMEHNCVPNTTQIIEDSNQNYRITFRAALPVRKSEHLTSIYTPILWGTHQRRQHLKTTKYFDCCCERCRDSTELGTFLSALRCMGTETEPCGGTQLPVKPNEEKVKWVCNKCKIKLPNRDLMKFVNHLGGEVEKTLARQPPVEELEELLGKLLNFLHPNHFHVYAVKHSLVQLYNNKMAGEVELPNDLVENKVKMCGELVEITKKVDPGNARLSMYLGVLLHEWFESRFTLLVRNYTSETRESFFNEIKELGEIVKENKRVLQYDIRSSNGAKLFQGVCQNGLKLQKWLKEKQLFDLV